MCGILGSVNVEIEDSLLDLISKRGPDDSGVERFSLNGNSVVFGHRRLSILDLSPAGHQPMVSDCGRYVIVFNGEIYNHLELRRKLSGVHFRGHSDTETILYYLAQNGLEAVENFNGIFSFAFFDREKSKLFLCRDPFGIKPLYYCNPKPGKLAFSSEIKPIQQLVHDSVDIVNLSELLHLRYSPSPDTLFKNIRKTAWTFDEFQRVLGVTTLMERGLSLEDAVDRVKLFLADYSRIPNRTARGMADFFLVPRYRISMLRLWGHLLRHPVKERESLEELEERIHRLEHKMYPEAISLFIKGKLKIRGRHVKII